MFLMNPKTRLKKKTVKSMEIQKNTPKKKAIGETLTPSAHDPATTKENVSLKP